MCWRCPLPDKPMRVALCDDHAVVRSGLRRILEDEADIEVVGEAGSADEAVALAQRHRPDVFVMDLGMPGEGGIAATKRLRELNPPPLVLVLTMHEDVAYLREALAAGAAGYVLKSAADVDLVQALRVIGSGGRYVHPTMGAALLDPPAPAESASERLGLSVREIEVLRMLALGHTNPEIASTLHLSVRTVETHRANVQQKLGLRTRAELARFVRQSGLSDAEPSQS